MLLLVFKPLADVAWVKGWAGEGLPKYFVIVVLTVVTIFLLLYWVWLIRLSLTVPMRSRTASLFWFLLGAPILGTALIGGSIVGLQWGSSYLFPLLDLGW